MDLLHPKPTPVELQIRGNLDLDSFNPHGISVYADDAGEAQIVMPKKSCTCVIRVDVLFRLSELETTRAEVSTEKEQTNAALFSR